MDPINNPTPNPNPAPAPEPTPNPAPTTGAPSINPEPSTAPVAPAAPLEAASVAPLEPTMPATPLEPTAPTVPSEPAAPAASPAPMAPLEPTTLPEPTAPVNPVINPAASSPFIQQNSVAATDPIMMPEQPKAPDPIEEELKAPMKAATPVPGSIGSAVSGPTEAIADTPTNPADNPFDMQPQTPSVPFNDPASVTEPSSPATKAKKTSRTTLIILVVVAAMVVVALAAVLIMQLTSQQPSPTPTPNNNSSNNSAIQNPDTEEETDDTANTTNEYDLVCTNSIKYAEDGTTYASGVASAETVYNYKFDGGNLISINTDKTITHTDGTSETSSDIMTVNQYRAKAGFDADTVLTIDAVTNNFETNINNFVTDTTVNSPDVTEVVNKCAEQ